MSYVNTSHHELADGSASTEAAAGADDDIGDSASQVRSTTSTTSTTRRLELSARRAALEAKTAFLQQQQEMEVREMKLRQQKEALDMKVRLAVIRAEEEVLANGSVIGNGNNQLPLHDTSADTVVLNPHASEFLSSLPNNVPDHANNNEPLQQSAEQGQRQQMQLLDAIQLPAVQMPSFDGNPLQYYNFIRLFESNVERDTVSCSSRLARLMQYCTGKARHVIAGCAVMAPDVGYARAKALLKSRFGDEYTISEAWINKVINGPSLKPTEREALQNLADDMANCYDTLKAMGCLAEASNQKTLVRIIQRLPGYLQHRWRKEVVGIRNRTGCIPNLEHVMTFIKEAAKEANDPVYGIMVESSDSKQRHNSYTGKRYTQRHTTVNAAATAGDASRSEQVGQCPMCSQQHSLFQCQAFKGADIQTRLALVKQKQLCFNCLRAGHRAFSCDVDRVCSVPGCRKRHTKFLHPVPSPAHRNQNQSADSQQGDATSGYAETMGAQGECSLIGAGGVRTALPIVPVSVKNPDTQAEVETYALLDSGSTHSFCSKNVMQQLSLKGDSVSLSLTTLEKSDSQMSTVAVCIQVSDVLGGESVMIKSAYVKDTLPISLQNMATTEDVQHWHHLQDIEIPTVNSDCIGLLIGQDVPEALVPLEIRHAMPGSGAPYATRTVLGWAVNGPLGYHTGRRQITNSFIQSGVQLEQQVERFWKLDTVSEADEEVNLSVNDRKAVNIWHDTVKHCDDGHYEVAVPFVQYPPALTDNVDIAKQRLHGLEAKLRRDPSLHDKYVQSMQNLFDNQYAEEVPHDEINSTPVWYLPHHAVISPSKPDKVRVVFDCSAKHCGRSLNDVVLQGPDLTNRLVGVLLRFRQERVAIMSDIQSMFLCVRVASRDRDLLRFLWWRDGNLDSEPSVYRMKVHLFGGVWSPSCCNFVLRRTAEDQRDQYDQEVVDTVLNNFYVDDCLKSVDTVERAVCIVHQLCRLLATGGFRLTKWISNSREVMSAIPQEDWSQDITKLELQHQALPVERALGVRWDVESDTLNFTASMKEKPVTRRGILSIVSSVFDPLGFLSPFILPAKRIIQDLCRRKLGWDSPLSFEDEQSWRSWLQDLRKLDQLKIDRCMKPPEFGVMTVAELHHFSDASRDAYGAVSYLRQLDESGRVHCSFVISKSRVAPLRTTTIPRLELCAAVLSTQLDRMIRRELDIDINRSVFWTDSTVVLQYIQNEDKRFHTFVANRISSILASSVPTQWRYVNTELNAADDVSRGLSAESIMNSTSWLKGPLFLWQDEKAWPHNPLSLHCIPDNDPEVRKDAAIYSTQTDDCNQVFDRIFQRRSSWLDLKKDMAYFLRVKCYLKNKVVGQPVPDMKKPLSVTELQQAEVQIVKYVQQQMFSRDVIALKAVTDSTTIGVGKSSSLYRLEPIMDNDDLLRVGGRLPSHPVILPNKHEVTDLIIRYCHVITGHSGKEHTLAQIRQQYWIIGGRSAVSKVLAKCARCKLRNAEPMDQRMSNLPADRITPGDPPFSYTGVDLFGPFSVKIGRSVVKRYGCVFTCLRIRAVHIEVVHTLDTDSFINALQRFVCRRGQIKELRSDNASNFVSAEKELRTAIDKWNMNKIHRFLQQKSIEWRFNTPTASHMGGVWERQIRSIRRILNVLMNEQSVDDESLSTLFCLVESIINNRPLTTVSSDIRDVEPLTPNHLLLLRQESTLPPGEFVDRDVYSRRRWRQVQYLADIFWRRWTREYIPTLHFRQKWRHPVNNLEVGDVVILVDDNAPRNHWQLGRVSETCPSSDGLVRTVKVATKTTTLLRPVHKLCLLERVSS